MGGGEHIYDRKRLMKLIDYLLMKRIVCMCCPRPLFMGLLINLNGHIKSTYKFNLSAQPQLTSSNQIHHMLTG